MVVVVIAIVIIISVIGIFIVHIIIIIVHQSSSDLAAIQNNHFDKVTTHESLASIHTIVSSLFFIKFMCIMASSRTLYYIAFT